MLFYLLLTVFQRSKTMYKGEIINGLHQFAPEWEVGL